METTLSVALVFIYCVTVSIGTELAQFSNISSSHTCSSNGSKFLCNATCRFTDSTDNGYRKPLLEAVHDECRSRNVSGIPNVAKTENGNITFGEENCTHTNITFDATSWAISFWVKYNGTYSSTLLEVRSNSSTLVSINTTNYRIGGNSSTITAQSDAWIHIVLRMTAKNAAYLDINGTNKFIGLVPNISSQINILFGPQTNSSAYVQMVDARIYNHSLTDRETTKLFNGTFGPKLVLNNTCMCPRDSPTVLPHPLNYGIFCMDHTNKSVYRLDNYTNHPVEYAVDRDENTYWNSGTTQSATITLDLKNVFRLSSIEINFLNDTIPSQLVLNLTYNGKLSMSNICGCNSSQPCNFLGGKFTYNLTNGTDLTNRTSYNTLLANTVNIQLNGNCSNNSFYAISEIYITGSCYCSGSEIFENCTFNVIDRKYNCVCTHMSNTNGSKCETCRNEFWRNNTFDLNCQNPCDCNHTGTFNGSCNENNGQCYCKSNVTGQLCNKCKHNSYNFSSNGCTECKCNPDGITECNSTGQCVCKPNVETESKQCQNCMLNYYGIINSSGCTECGCNAIGAKYHSCNETSGQCDCKSSVKGRTCDTCKDEYWNLQDINTNGCASCNCNVVGSINNICNRTSGQCLCHDGVETTLRCEPELIGTYMSPTFGPIAGGTAVTLSGRQLGNEEVNVTVFLKGVSVTILDRNSYTIVFKTMKSDLGPADVKIRWFKPINYNGPYPEHIVASSLTFNYRENAVIQEQTSNLQSFSSGWCNIKLKGQALDSVYRPEIILYGSNGAPNVSGTCSHPSGDSTSILCKPPNVSTWVTNGTYSYGVVLDGITEFLNITTSVIEIHPDPTFHTNEDIVYRNVFDKLLTVRGEGFSRACDKIDFRLHLSKRGDCEIKDLTDTEITCDPKETFPGTGEKEILKIYIGVFEKDIGTVEFRTFWKLQEFIYICIGVGAFVLIVIITIIVCCICRHRYRHEKREDEIGLESMSNRSQKRPENNYVGVENPMNRQDEKDLDKSYSDLFLERLPHTVSELVASSIIDKSHVEIGHICTVKGTYTRVINGKYASSSSTPYAGDGNTIKTLVENYPALGEMPKWLCQGLQECTRLRDVVHEKVLRLRGIAIDENKIYVVYPAMERTLKDYIRKNFGSQVINVDDVVTFCFDVGEGMNELHRQGIVHKDLAARNCMIDSAKVVKVADASFASDLYPEEYMKQLNRDIPVRWMAVESLQQTGFYDKATDMWSFGVLLWEVFTGCRYLPYQDLPDKDIHLNVVVQGYRLGKPENIPKAYLDILDQCMNTDSNLRPTFETALSLMNNALENPGEAIYQNQEENYVNKTAINHYMNKSAVGQSIQSDQPAPPPRKRIA